MTTTVDKITEPGAEPQGGSTMEARAKALGLPSATALVIGSIIGTGVFTMPAVMAGAGTELDHHPRRDRGRRGAARRAVRSAHQAGPERRGRPVRLHPPRVRRLRRVPHRVVLLDHLLGRQRGDRRVVGAVRRVAVRHQQPVGVDELRHRADRTVDPRRDQPRGRPPDGVVPEPHRGPEVRAAAARRRRRLVLRQDRRTSARSTHRAAASTTASASPPASRCSRSSASSARRSPPAGSRTRAATSVGRRSTAPPPAACSTSR